MKFNKIQQKILELKEKKNALILAHNYQVPEIQDIADHVGDSLGLSLLARDAEEDLIVFCGVYFMAETAKVLNPNATILSPEPNAGCSLVDSMSVQQLLDWKKQYPDAVAVGYVNTTAEMKANLDYCVTSSNAVNVINSIPEDQDILFLPDMFLGNYIKKITGRENMHVWMGECHVHAGIDNRKIDAAQKAHPDADLLVHPECGCSTSCMYLSSIGDIKGETQILSTGGMIDYAMKSTKTDFLVATETGIIHQLEKRTEGKNFIPVSEEAVCQYMKMITPEKVLNSLKDNL